MTPAIPIPDYRLIGQPRRQKVRRRLSSHYVQRYRLLLDPPRKIRVVSLKTKDKGMARSRADRMVKAKIAEIVTANTPRLATRDIKLHDLVDQYVAYMRSEGNSKLHCDQADKKIKLILDRAKCKTYADVNAAGIVTAISGYITENKRSAVTARRYRESLKSFTKWMFSVANKWDCDPLATMAVLKGDTTPRRSRGILTADEFALLLKKTRTQPEHHKLTGQQRAMLYVLAAQTGARAHELSSLKKSSINLFAKIITIACTISKRRETDEIHLSGALVKLVQPWLAEQPDTGRLFPGGWYKKAAEMLKQDLTAAKIEYEIATPKGKRVRDFHALRARRVTDLILSGASQKVIKEVARLSCESLIDRYSKLPSETITATVESVPLVAG